MLALFSIVLVTACGDNPKQESKTPPKAKVESPKPPPKKEKPKEEPAVASAEPEKAANPGQEVYVAVCQQCHQATGQGVPGLYPPLAGSDWLSKEADVLIRIILHGLQGPIKVNGQDYGAAMAMTAQGALEDQKIADALTYVRSSWGNTYPPITVDEVKATRSKYADRKTQWTAQELESK